MRSACFVDFDAFAASVRNVECRMMFRNAERRMWRTASVDLERVVVQRGDLGSGNIAQGQMDQGVCILYVPLTHATEYRVNGTPMAGASCGIMPPGGEFCVSTKVAHDWGTISLPADDLDAAGDHLFGGAYVQPTSPRTVSRLRAAFRDILAAAAACPSFESSPAAESAAARLRDVARSVVARETAATRPSGGRSRIPRRQIVRRCQEFLEEQEGSLVRVPDLAAAAGTSERTLREAFLEYFGLAPHRYMQLVQLHRVHRALRDADPEAATVTKVLVENGVWEFGRFAGRYRSQFGELPSATLRARRTRS